MTSDDVRVYVVERPPYVVVNSFVAPGKTHHAFACTGHGSKTKVEAAGYGSTEEEALADLERAASVPAAEAVAPTARKLPMTRIGHLAKASDPSQPFHSVCIVEGCGREIVRVYGVQARRSDWRHLKKK